MKEITMKNVRMSVIGIFAAIALIFAIGEPTNDATWFQDFFISKSIAAFMAYIAYLLFKKWNAKGLLPDMDDDDSQIWK